MRTAFIFGIVVILFFIMVILEHINSSIQELTIVQNHLAQIQEAK